MDLVFRYARGNQLPDVRAGHVKGRLSGTVGPQHRVSAPAEGGPHGVHNLRADLVTVRGDRGPDAGDHVAWVSTEAPHGRHRRGGDAADGPAPAGVHTREHPGHRIMQNDRDTVRRQDSQHESGNCRHKPVGQRDRVRGRAGAPTAMLVGHDSDIRAVGLRAEDEVVQGGAECRGRSRPVRPHVGIVVPDPQAQIERGVAAAGNPAIPGGDKNIDQPLVKARPTQYLQAGRCSAQPRRRHACGHLPRPRRFSAFNVLYRPSPGGAGGRPF